MNTMRQTSWLLLVVLLGVSTVDVSAQNLFIITRQPMNDTICKGEESVLNCGYFATVAIPPQWRINETVRRRSDIDDDQDDLLQWIEDDNNTNTTRLLVGPVDERFVGRTTFQCEIPLGTPVRSDTAVLTVIGMPPTPTITVNDVGLDTITVSWTIPDYDPNNVCGSVMYNVTISIPGFDETIRDRIVNFTGLTPNTSYTIAVTPDNDAGDGPPASIVVLTLTPSEPSPPTDVSLSLRFISRIPDITASWIAPELGRNMTEVEQYNLTLFIYYSNGSSQVVTTLVPASTTMVDIFSVFSSQGVTREMYTNYSISVAAINSVGQGEFTKFESVVTRYIQEALATPGVGMITFSCITAPSEPSVRCNVIYKCSNGTTGTVLLTGPLPITNTESCNVTFKVTIGSGDAIETLEQITYTNVTPLVRPTTTTTTITATPGLTPIMPPSGSSTSEDDDDDTGPIVGGVIGGLVCVIVLIIVCVCWCRYRRRRRLALIPCAIKCTCCTCLLCAYCNKKRRGSLKPMTTGNDKTDTGKSNSSGDSRDSPNSADAFVMKGNTQPEAGYCEVAPQKQVKHNNGITSEYSVVGTEGNATKNAPQPVALYSEIEPTPKKTIRVQQLPEYSIVHKPTKAEGKVDNYTDLADIGPYPTKKPPQDKVQYTEVTPSDATPSDSGTQYTNVDHINDGPVHLSTDHKAQYSVVQ